MSSNLEKALRVRFDSNIDFVANEKSSERRFEQQRLQKECVSNEESSLENLLLLLRFTCFEKILSFERATTQLSALFWFGLRQPLPHATANQRERVLKALRLTKSRQFCVKRLWSRTADTNL